MGGEEDLSDGAVCDGEASLGSSKMEKKARRKSTSSAGAGAGACDDDETQTIECLFKVKKLRISKKGKTSAVKVRAENPRDGVNDDSVEMSDTLASFRKKLKGPKKSKCAGLHSDIGKGLPLLDESCVLESEERDAVGSDEPLENAGKSGSKSSRCDSIKEEEDKGVLGHHQNSEHPSYGSLEDSLSIFVKKVGSSLAKRAPSSKRTKLGDKSLISDVEFKHDTYKVTDNVKSTLLDGGSCSPSDGTEDGTLTRKRGRKTRSNVLSQTEVARRGGEHFPGSSHDKMSVQMNSSVSANVLASTCSDADLAPPSGLEDLQNDCPAGLVILGGNQNLRPYQKKLHEYQKDESKLNQSPSEVSNENLHDHVNNEMEGEMIHCLEGSTRKLEHKSVGLLTCDHDSTLACNEAVINACSHRLPVKGGEKDSSISTLALDQDLNDISSVERKKEYAKFANGDTLISSWDEMLRQDSALTTGCPNSAQEFLEKPFVHNDKLCSVTAKNHAAQSEEHDLSLPSSSEILHGTLQSSIARVPDLAQLDRRLPASSRSIEEYDSASMSTRITKEAIQNFKGYSNQLAETTNDPSLPITMREKCVVDNAPSYTRNQVLNIKDNDVVNCNAVFNQQTEPSVSSENDSGDNHMPVPRAMRNIKKPRHGDMAYEGDADWDVIVHEQGLFASTSLNTGKSSRAKDKLYPHLLDEVTIGGPAAVAAGLKAHAVTAIEKIKFKDVLKRRAGLQEYLECRNFILGCWSKDVKHILPLDGVTDKLLQDKSARLSLVHEIYLFLDSNGYINSGIASECKTSEYKSVFHTALEELDENQAFVLKASNLEAKVLGDSDQVGSLLNAVAVKKDGDLIADKKRMEGKDPQAPGASMENNMQLNEHAVGNMVLDMQPAFSICDREPSKSCRISEPVSLSVTDQVAPCNYNIQKQECAQKCVPCPSSACKSESDVSLKHPCDEYQLQEHEEGIIAHEEHTGVRSTLLQSSKLSEKTESDSNVLRRIIIIGAGPSGLYAARHLQRQGFSVIVLEARDRIGGRVYTDRSSLSVPVDLGASIITGIEADIATERRPDPSALICSQLGLDLTVLNSDCPLYDIATGHKVPTDLDEALEAEYNSILDDMVLIVAQNGETAMKMSLEDGLEYALKRRRLAQAVSAGMDAVQNNVVCDPGKVDIVDQSSFFESIDGAAIVPSSSILSPLERRVMDWHYAHLEYGCAAPLEEVSLPYWNQDDVYGGFGGAHCMIKGGFGTVVESLGQGLDIHLNQIVTDIIYNLDEAGGTGDCKQKVRVITSNGSEYVGDAVLITVPLGCLKADTIKFTPALPEWKRASIQRLGFGVLNKVILEFSEVFWDENIDYFGATAEESSRRGHCFMFWNVTKTVGKPVLISLVAGKAARDGQTMSKSDHVNHALKVLRNLFGEASVPDPIASIVTNWGVDPYSKGAYSYVAIGASGEDYDILGKPVENCLFFAGEATCKEHPDTVGGAMISGLREAVRIVDIFRNGKDYLAEVDAMEVVQKQSDSERIEVRDISKRLDACRLSTVICKNSPDGTYILPTEEALLQDMFFNAKTISGRLHLAKELLRLPVQSLKSFAGTKKGLITLNTWILDSLGKNATPLLRHCVRLLVHVSTDLVAVRLSGIGRTVKEKVCMHSSRDIRSVASQLVSMWIEVFRKEKAANGGLKHSMQATVSEPSRVKHKDITSGKSPLRVNKEASDNKQRLQLHSSSITHSASKASSKKPEMKAAKFEHPVDNKLKLSCSQRTVHAESKVVDNLTMSEEAAAAFSAAEAARLAAIKAAEAYASSEAEANALRELPKIPSFQKFARREHYAQLDEFDLRRKSGGLLGRQDCLSEIDSRNCRVRNWSVDFSAACPNLESAKISGDNYTQGSFSNEIACPSNLREHSGENGEINSRLTKAWVDTCTADTGGVKNSLAIERWQSQAMDAEVDIYRNMFIRDEEDSNKMSMPLSKKHQSRAGGSATSQVAESKSVEGQSKGANLIKQGVVDYVASLLMPLYKTKTIDKESYKMIMKKTATKVMEQCSEKEKVMAVYDFLDSRRKNKIRSFVDRLIESYMTTRQHLKS